MNGATYRRARLAALMAQGHTLTSAAADMGVTRQRASQLWVDVKRTLGEQAQ